MHVCLSIYIWKEVFEILVQFAVFNWSSENLYLNLCLSKADRDRQKVRGQCILAEITLNSELREQIFTVAWVYSLLNYR
jgi:hypothetical protein